MMGVEVWTLRALLMDLPVWPCSETKGPRAMENRRTSSLGSPGLTGEPSSSWSPREHPRWLLLIAESAAKLPLAPPSSRVAYAYKAVTEPEPVVVLGINVE